MTLPQHVYGDPLEVMMRKEARTCKGCALEQIIDAFGSKYVICSLKGKKHGKRCDAYQAKP